MSDVSEKPITIKIHQGAIQKIRKVAIDRECSISSLLKEALQVWWATQPDLVAKLGNLFPVEEEPQ